MTYKLPLLRSPLSREALDRPSSFSAPSSEKGNEEQRKQEGAVTQQVVRLERW